LGVGRVARGVTALAFAVGLTLLFFLLLPVIQEVGRPPEPDVTIREVDTANLAPPPPPAPEEEKEPEKEEEPPPPDLAEQEAPPLDLAQLELALNPGFGGGAGSLGDFALKLETVEKGGQDTEAIFSLADLDQAPRPVVQPPPEYPAELRRKKLQGTVNIVFIVDRQGRVANPLVQSSTHAAFERPALQAVRRWRFEPGKRAGEPVQFKMRVPITFTSK
jgi:protein TonB